MFATCSAKLEKLNLPKASLSSLRKETQVQTPSHRRLFRVCRIQDWRCQLPGAVTAFLVPSFKKVRVLAPCSWRWAIRYSTLLAVWLKDKPCTSGKIKTLFWLKELKPRRCTFCDNYVTELKTKCIGRTKWHSKAK